jgi:hypothetical protein
MSPTPPARPGAVARWVAFWDRHRRPVGHPGDGSNIFVAYVITLLCRWAFPSPEADGAHDLVLLIWVCWLAVQICKITWRWALILRDTAAMLWEWRATLSSSGTCSRTRTATRGAGLGSAVREALRAARRGRSG